MWTIITEAWPILLLGFGCVFLILTVHFITLWKNKASGIVEQEALFISTTKEDRERFESCLPTQGTEDVSHLLSIEYPQQPQRKRVGEVCEIFPDEEMDWVIDVQFIAPPLMTESEILDSFSHFPTAYERHPSIYGIEKSTGLWTCCGRRDGEPFSFTQIVFSICLFLTWDDFKLPSAEDLQKQVETIEEAAGKIGQMRIKARTTPEQGAEKAQHLKALCERERNVKDDVLVVLAAPEGTFYEGKNLWDVMLCLGLKWGDMDIFHLPNKGFEGDDYLFSVWTSTSPGYFFPEAIAEDKVKTQDLVLGFSIARTYEPSLVFDAMMRAANYAVGRLGGKLLDENGKELNADAMKIEIQNRVDYLKKEGIEPGTSKALRLF